ncbi:MAG TPA: hypothetical protein VEB60_01890 [Candidatus Paceibacterota bacterium]|nr:hypothetical protein [Candidatus Paceibacterota bacterium]
MTTITEVFTMVTACNASTTDQEFCGRTFEDFIFGSGDLRGVDAQGSYFAGCVLLPGTDIADALFYDTIFENVDLSATVGRARTFDRAHFLGPRSRPPKYLRKEAGKEAFNILCRIYLVMRNHPCAWNQLLEDIRGGEVDGRNLTAGRCLIGCAAAKLGISSSELIDQINAEQRSFLERWKLSPRDGLAGNPFVGLWCYQIRKRDTPKTNYFSAKLLEWAERSQLKIERCLSVSKPVKAEPLKAAA